MFEHIEKYMSDLEPRISVTLAEELFDAFDEFVSILQEAEAEAVKGSDID